MEMKSFVSDKVGPGGETPVPKKIARKSTTYVRKNEPTYDANSNDPMAIEIYEVVGNMKNRFRAGGLTDEGELSNNKICDSKSFVIGDEVLLSLTNAKDPLNRTPQQKFLDLARMIQAEKAIKKNFTPYLNKVPIPKLTYSTITTNKMIFKEPTPPKVGSTYAGVTMNKQPSVPAVEDCGYMNFHGNEEIVTDSHPSPKKADGDDKKTEKEKSAGGVSSKEKVPGEGAEEEKIDGVIKASGSDTGTKNGSSVPEENAKKNTENKGPEFKQDVPDKALDKVPDKVPEQGRGKVPTEFKSEVPEGIPANRIVRGDEIDLANGVEEVVISSGFAWGKDDQPRTEYCDVTGNVREHRNEYLVEALKTNKTSSVGVVKKIKGIMVAENGNAVEIREGKLVEKTGEEDKKAIQSGEAIGSGLVAEAIIGEGNKRKRIPKGEETKQSNPKKRKVEKSKKDDSNGFGDGKDKGKSQVDKGPKKDSAKPGSSIRDHSTLEETIDRVASGHLSLPFLESLRGEIKSLSRADLEELIVQKLCEVITERSVVGHLRKRAEALEKNQERWKEKVMSLTKQIKEMDMVMKNYMSEVRRHHTEKSYQMIAPLRVTRSVGLQVSFTSTHSVLAKAMPKCCANTHHRHEKEGKTSSRSILISQAPSKKIPILPTISPKKPLVIDSKNTFSTKSGLTITLQPASSSSETQYASKPIPIQPKLSILPATDSPSSSMVDLTREEERHLRGIGLGPSQPTLTVGPPGQVKVVNHIQPAQSPVGAVTLLISNPASPPCSTTITSEGQNRQLSIPGTSTHTIQRHILPAFPTLIYKPNALIQPGSQVMTSHARTSLLAKSWKHPAPLPLPPANQIHKPDWKLSPPRPSLRLSKGDTGIVLSWNMVLGPEYETIVSYQLFAYQESDSPPSSSMWKRVGDLKALRLPMACTLSQFLPRYKYFFAVRAVDIHSRVGPFSLPSSIELIP